MQVGGAERLTPVHLGLFARLLVKRPHRQIGTIFPLAGEGEHLPGLFGPPRYLNQASAPGLRLRKGKVDHVKRRQLALDIQS
ncbi:MAG: hypothetical protein C0507_22570 [Cyanobacteria bacterium PR.3.49]|nr:hypothetical protein [Cyanobacteria bacterium PR.3.49]